jgi:glycerophosphoryl diester phosphodiesterase
MPRLLLVVAQVVSAACIAVLALLVVFDAQAERITAGRTPAEFSARLDPRLLGDYGHTIVIAHNAGDAIRPATEAVAWGVDGVEIDVHSAGGELFAAHDAPVPFLEDLVFRGPSLRAAWDVARLRDTVLLHLKEHSPAYLRQVHAFLATHRVRHEIVQTYDPATLRYLRRADPQVTRLLLVFHASDLTDLRRNPGLVRLIDGVSVREQLLTPAALAWLKQQRLKTFAWTVNDERRMNQLVRAGVDGLITERLDFMRLLGTGKGVGR